MAINWTLFPWFTLPMSENMVPYSQKHWFWVDVAEQWTSNGVHVCFDGLCRHSTLFRGTSDSINSIKRYWNSTWTTMRVPNRYVSFSNNECDIKPLTTQQNPGTREHHKSTRAVLSMALWCLRMMPFSAASTKAGMRNTSAALGPQPTWFVFSSLRKIRSTSVNLMAQLPIRVWSVELGIVASFIVGHLNHKTLHT